MSPLWLSDLKRALLAGTIYFLALFALGFFLGTIRVIFVAPRYGQLAGILAEVPVMLVAAYVICRWVLKHWQVSPSKPIRWTMVLLFLLLLFAFETLLGLALFGRTLSEQLATLATLSGAFGISAQVIAALLPVFLSNGKAH